MPKPLYKIIPVKDRPVCPSCGGRLRPHVSCTFARHIGDTVDEPAEPENAVRAHLDSRGRVLRWDYWRQDDYVRHARYFCQAQCAMRFGMSAYEAGYRRQPTT